MADANNNQYDGNIMKKLLAMILGLSLTAMMASAAEGDPKPNPAPPTARPKLPEWAQKYDKNGDGKIDKEESVTLRKERDAEMLKKYDKDGDGKLDDTERKAMTEDRRKEREEMIKKRQAEVDKQEKQREEKK